MPKTLKRFTFSLFFILVLSLLLVAIPAQHSQSAFNFNWFTHKAYKPAKKKAPKRKMLDITPISQFPELPTGCEITAVAMLMDYKGVDLSKTDIADEIPYSPDGDMETGFWGNPYDDSGYTMYPPAWADLFNQYLGSFTDLSGASLTKLRATLKDNKPIVAWINYHGQPAHSVLLIGYNQDTLTFNDPYTGKRKTMTAEKFWKIASYQGHRAMTY